MIHQSSSSRRSTAAISTGFFDVRMHHFINALQQLVNLSGIKLLGIPEIHAGVFRINSHQTMPEWRLVAGTQDIKRDVPVFTVRQTQMYQEKAALLAAAFTVRLPDITQLKRVYKPVR